MILFLVEFFLLVQKGLAILFRGKTWLDQKVWEFDVFMLNVALIFQNLQFLLFSFGFSCSFNSVTTTILC